MTARQGPGGRIAPDGRQPSAPGVGKNARRHDLERPATPGMTDSDLQQGDVQRLEQAQRVAPIQNQQPARGGRPAPAPAGQESAPTDMSVPDPIEFAKGRFGGSRGPAATQNAFVQKKMDSSAWLPFLEMLAASPRASVGVTQAYIAQLSNALSTSSNPSSHVLDMQALDDAVEAGLNG